MAGAKGHGRLDQERHAILRHPRRVMASVDEEAPRLDRLELALHMRDPVGIGHLRDDEGSRAVGHGHERQGDLVRRFLKIGADLVLARTILDLEDADACRLRFQVLERLGEGLGGVAGGKRGQGGIDGHGASGCGRAGAGLRPRLAEGQARAGRTPASG